MGASLRHANGGQRPVAVVVGTLLFGLVVRVGYGFQIVLLLLLLLMLMMLLLLLLLPGVVMALVVDDAARQLVDAERVVDVVRVGADRLMVSGGHHHRQRHAHRHRRALVLGHVRRERRGRGQAGLRQHARAGQAGQGAQATGTGRRVGLLVVRVAQAARRLVVVRLVARVAAALDVPYATFFAPRKP